MRLREMAVACSSELVREQHQCRALAEFSHLGELMLGQFLSSLRTRGLQTVTVVCMESFTPLALFSKVQTSV